MVGGAEVLGEVREDVAGSGEEGMSNHKAYLEYVSKYMEFKIWVLLYGLFCSSLTARFDLTFAEIPYMPRFC